MPLIVKDGIDIETRYDSFHPNRIQIKFAKYILGVHKSATNIAVLGELILYPLSIHSMVNRKQSIEITSKDEMYFEIINYSRNFHISLPV
jgi:hypothetical protein